MQQLLSRTSGPADRARDSAPAEVTPDSSASLAISRVLGKVVVTLIGDLDARTIPRLRHLISDLVEGQGNLNVEIDLGDAGRVDDAGVGLLVETFHQSRRRGGIFAVRRAPSNVRAALDFGGLLVA